jgi:hypothetical protein
MVDLSGPDGKSANGKWGEIQNKRQKITKNTKNHKKSQKLSDIAFQRISLEEYNK